MSKTTTLLIANLGTTPEPIIFSLGKAAATGVVKLVVIYGKQIPGQLKTPLDMLAQVKQAAEKQGVDIIAQELTTPEEFAATFAFYKSFISEINEKEKPVKVIIDVTGGTKIMSAALINAALTLRWHPEIDFAYIGGERESAGRVARSEAMRLVADTEVVSRERMEETLRCIRNNDFRLAVEKAQLLPVTGNAGFVKQAAEAIWKWDNFHYNDVAQHLRGLARRVPASAPDNIICSLADTITRLSRVADKIFAVEKWLKAMSNSKSAQIGTLPPVDDWLWLAADTFANALRREKSQPVDCVLRCYRTIEMITQYTLYRSGINVWAPDWQKLTSTQTRQYLERLNLKELPKKLSLHNGLIMLEVIHNTGFTPATWKSIKDTQDNRNHSYLEHGYNKVLPQSAASIVKKTEKIGREILSMAQIAADPFQMAQELAICA